MELLNRIKSIFKPPNQSLVIKDKDPQFVEKICSQLGLTNQLNGLMADKFAINVAINLLASLVSGCVFKTFLNGEPTIGEEYYLWNISPNSNQNSTQFLQELIYRLCRYNECVVFEYNGELIIAESFDKKEFALKEMIFTNIERTDYTLYRPFKMSEVLYFKLNNEDVSKLFTNLYSGYEQLISEAITRYKNLDGERIILEISTTAAGAADFEEKLKQLMTEYFKDFFAKKNSVLPIFDGFKVNREQKTSKSNGEIADIKALIAESFDRAGQAFRIPPAVLKGEIADIKQATDNLLTFGLDPICDMLSEEITRKRYGKYEYLKGNYLKVDSTCIKHIDIFSIAEKIDKLIACGAYSIDELREKAGDTKLNTEFSQKHWITKNYQDINLIEGGEKVE